MATRSQAFRNEHQRHGVNAKKKRKLDARKPRAARARGAHDNDHAARKASYAEETPAKTGAKSRKSTRASANRMKADASLNIREELVETSPAARQRRTRARASRVRGSARR